MVRAAALICIVLAGIASRVDARLTVAAKAQYETSEGMSEWQETNVSFLTSGELNRLTMSLDYGSFDSFATIFFASGQMAVIKITSPSLICGTAFDNSCLPLGGRMSGKDQKDRRWEICTGMWC